MLNFNDVGLTTFLHFSVFSHSKCIQYIYKEQKRTIENSKKKILNSPFLFYSLNMRQIHNCVRETKICFNVS